jgi:hypothetical protein
VVSTSCQAVLWGLSPGAGSAGGGDPAVAAAPGEVVSRAEVGLV